MGIVWCILLYGGILVSCQGLGVNLISGINNSVITSQSSLYIEYLRFGSLKAIDGKDSQRIDTCGCCSVTNGAIPSWWQINLGNKYLIDALEVIGREKDYEYQLQDADIYAGNVSLAGDNTNGVVVYTIPKIINDNSHFIKYLQPAIIAQYFIIQLQQKILTICEFKLYEKLCDVGRFGMGCSHQCHCLDEDTCNSVTGICKTSGCLDGWQGLACDKICGHGTFGYNCSSECHCKDDADCEPTTGFCSDRCAPRWRGQSCDIGCDHGTFGFNCLRGCHCKYGAECDLQTGFCSDGCAPGWQGQSCDIDTNLIRLVYGKVTTQMSSVAHNWSSDLAIDGREGPDPSKCQCCSVTMNAEMSWWRLDLGSIFPIKAVTIYGSNQESIYQPLQGFQMYLGNNTDLNPPAVYIDTKSIPVDNTYIITLPDTLTRYVTIRRPGVLTLCEITLFGERIGIGNTEQKGAGETGENETCSNINVTSAIIGTSVGVAISLACAVSIGIIVWKYRTSKRTESKNEYTRPAHSSAPSEVPDYDALDDRQDTPRPSSIVFINESVTGV